MGKIWVSTPRCTSHLGCFCLGIFAYCWGYLLGVFDRVFLRISADFFKYAAKTAPTGGKSVYLFLGFTIVSVKTSFEFSNVYFPLFPSAVKMAMYFTKFRARPLTNPRLYHTLKPTKVFSNKISDFYRYNLFFVLKYYIVYSYI